ncbi:hypothetical protein C1T30_43850 [Bacillus sp. MBGLi97]|nr:hypothetical protein C1T30_43850 [Bacillus sp. MBGLi97]
MILICIVCFVLLVVLFIGIAFFVQISEAFFVSVDAVDFFIGILGEGYTFFGVVVLFGMV